MSKIEEAKEFLIELGMPPQQQNEMCFPISPKRRGESKASTQILDACCGSRMFWFDKANPNVTFCDIRDVDRHEYYPGRFIEIKPDVQCDFRHLPFPDETFWHIVFDPPHMIHAGKASWTREKYGVLDATWPDMLHDGFEECWRVLKPNGTLIFKWSSIQIPLRDILKHIDHKPLYGHKSGKHSNTHWLAFVKAV